MEEQTGGAQATEEPGAEEGAKETHYVCGDEVLGKIKELIHEGNIRRIIIKNDEGRTLIEIPLAFGLVGALLAPHWAAIGAIAALVTNCSIEVERIEKG